MNPKNKSVSRQQLDLFEAPDALKEAEFPPSTDPTPVYPEGDDPELTELSRGLVRALGLEELAGRVLVTWNSRLRTTAGRAYRTTQVVELNPALVEISEEEIDRTLRHELAHLVAYHRAAGRTIEPHGPEWKRACADLGIPGEERCHDLPFERRTLRRKFVYECPACGHQLYRVRRIKRAAACYDCCRKHNSGRFDTRFELSERVMAPGEGKK